MLFESMASAVGLPGHPRAKALQDPSPSARSIRNCRCLARACRMAHFRSRETVESALAMSDAGVPDQVNADIHGVALRTIRTWRRRYQRDGRIRGGPRGYRGTRCPRCDGAELDEEAYALLL